MSETKNECGFQQLQDTISQLHEGYKELRSQNEMLRKELDEKTEAERQNNRRVEIKILKKKVDVNAIEIDIIILLFILPMMINCGKRYFLYLR